MGEIRIPSNYEIEFRESNYNKRQLVIALASSNNYSYYKKEFYRSTLFIKDISYSYYLLYPWSLTDWIKKFIIEKKF